MFKRIIDVGIHRMNGRVYIRECGRFFQIKENNAKLIALIRASYFAALFIVILCNAVLGFNLSEFTTLVLLIFSSYCVAMFIVLGTPISEIRGE